MYRNHVKPCIYTEAKSATPSQTTRLAVDGLAVDGGPVLGDLPDARVVLVLSRLPLVVPPRGDGAVAPRVRGSARVAAGEGVGEVGAVQVLVAGAEVGDGPLDLVAGRVELGLVVDAARLGGAELDGVAGAAGIRGQRSRPLRGLVCLVRQTSETRHVLEIAPPGSSHDLHNPVG